MLARGRSDDLSPIALLRNNQAARPRTLTATPAFTSNLAHRLPSHDAFSPSPDYSYCNMATTEQPVASTSRLSSLPLSVSSCPSPHSVVDSALSCYPPSSALASISPASSPLGPLTPPDYEDPYTRHRRHPHVASLFDDYHRPPSPPRSLKDQMQIAYALDDMHLAKILYLKLHGIEVTGDDDPRITAVKDEDFTSSFVPPGGFMLEEADERRCKESERRERERRKRIQREERLRACERLWEASARWIKEEREKVVRKKEEEARRHRKLEREAKEREREREERQREQEMMRHTRKLRTSGQAQRPLLSYSSLSSERSSQRRLSPAPSLQEDPAYFTSIPFSPNRSPSSSYSASPPTTPDHHTLTLPRLQHELSLHSSQLYGRTVRFTDVLASMHGPLFPSDETSRSTAHSRSRSYQQELFHSLVNPLDEDDTQPEVEKSRRSAAPADSRSPQVDVRVAYSLTSNVTSESADVSATSSSVSTVTRSNSWFSFSGRSLRSSVSTAMTTPSSSLLSFKSSSPLPSPLVISSVLHVEPERVVHSCRRPQLVLVLSPDHPLNPSFQSPVSPYGQLIPTINRGRAPTRDDATQLALPITLAGQDSGLVHRVSRSVSTLMDMAAQFQRAYVKATMFSVGTDSYSRSRSCSRSRSSSRSPSRSPWRMNGSPAPYPSVRSGKLRPEGYRAASFDVQIFLSASVDEEVSDEPQLSRSMIPLSTHLPGSSPHARVFPMPIAPPRSPFRAASPVPGTPCLPRLRPVANPVLLRLQALQNICTVQALTWEGRSREGRMSAGKEKIVGVAWEGIGRSGLGWEVSAVVC